MLLQKREFYLNNIIALGVFLSQRCLVQNANRKYRHSCFTCIFVKIAFDGIIHISDSNIFFDVIKQIKYQLVKYHRECSVPGFLSKTLSPEKVVRN